jgi:urate oxidase
MFTLHIAAFLLSRYGSFSASAIPTTDGDSMGRRHVERVFVEVEKLRWARMGGEGGGACGFYRDGEEKWVVHAELEVLNGLIVGKIVAGITDLLGNAPVSFHVPAATYLLAVLKTTGSSFEGFIRDEYTTLKDTKDRILSTRVDLSYEFEPVRILAPVGEKGVGMGENEGAEFYEDVMRKVRKCSLDVFVEDESVSVQVSVIVWKIRNR